MLFAILYTLPQRRYQAPVFFPGPHRDAVPARPQAGIIGAVPDGDSLFQQSRVELKVDIAYHLDMEKMPDVPENAESAAGFRYRFIHLCDPVTGEQLPRGARLLGTLRWLNEEHTAFAGALGSVSGQYAGDTIRLGFFDPWLNGYVGFLDVKIR